MLKNEVFIHFSIQNFDKVPSYITNYLEIQPSKTWLKNDFKIGKGSLQYKNNGWEIRLKKKNVLHIDNFLEEMIDILSYKKIELNKLYNVTKKISIIVYSNNMMPSFVFNHNIISFLYETGIDLEQDIYCS